MFQRFFLLGMYRSPDGDAGGAAVVDLFSDEAPDLLNPGATDADEPDDPAPGNESNPRPGPALGEDIYKMATGKAAESTPGTAPVPAGEDGGAAAETGNPLDVAAEKLLGLPGGLIKFQGEEEPVAFSTLSADEQANVLRQHAEAQAERQPTAAELQVLADLRKAGGVEAYGRQLAGQLQSKPATMLSAEEVHLRDIARQFPSFTEEQRQAMLDERKASKLFEEVTNTLRSQQTQQEQQAQAAAEQAENEQIAQSIVDAARDLKEIDGYVLTDELRREMLSDLLEGDDADGDSRFLSELNDPKQLVRARFWTKYGPALVQNALKGGSSGGSQARTGKQSVKEGQHVPPSAETAQRQNGKQVENLLE